MAPTKDYATRERNSMWKGDQIGYSGAHMRLRRERGPAGEQVCACGAPADEWSYDGRDPEERVQVWSGFEVRYSADPAHYFPRCRSCHRLADAPAPREACVHGHPFTEENTRIRITGGKKPRRVCRTCHRVSEMARYYAGKKS